MILGLVEHRDLYQDQFIVQTSIRNKLAAEIVDKESFAALCQQADVPTPKTAFPKSVEERISSEGGGAAACPTLENSRHAASADG